MEIRFQNLGPEKWNAEIALVLCCEDEHLPSQYPDMDMACPWLAVSPALADFKGRPGDMAIFHGHPDLNIPRVLALGLGKRSDVSLKIVRNAMASGVRKCRELCLKSMLLPEPVLNSLPGGRDRLIEECVCAAYLGLYRFTRFKTKKNEDPADPEWLAIGFNDSVQDSGEAAARKGELDAGTIAMARDLANMPGNMLYPETMALRAAELAGKYGFICNVLDERALEEAGAGCLLAVGQGSAHPPRLIVVEHAPKGHEQEKPIIFVGKGITFDSGGLCLKPAASMGQMKCDMSGAAAVLSAISALAQEGIGRRVVGILACAENMPDGGAYRPGDILTALDGQSVEVVNTDAEGRLALADALAYAQKHWTPAAIVDIATLTGACAVALGTGMAGLFCDDDGLGAHIEAVGAACGENFWRLPLWSPYEEQLKSEIADIKHTASREGGAITAALFLKNFVNKGELWAHMDIAGVDWNKKSIPLCPEGASGFGARTLLDLARGGMA